MPVLTEDQDPALYQVASHCAICNNKLKSSCVREVRVELSISEEGGGGMAPDIVLCEEETAKSLLFCSTTCAQKAARIVAAEVQNPTLGEDGRYAFPNHLMWRGKIEKWDIHFTRIRAR